MTKYIIEICPNEPRASVCDMEGQSVARDPDIADCRASGDNEAACLYVLSLGVDWRIIAHNASGDYENREATDDEMTATARAIYSDSDADFDDVDTAKLYLVWSAASDAQSDTD